MANPTGVEVIYLISPDGAGHPAATLASPNLITAVGFAGMDYIGHGGAQSVTSSTTLVDSTLNTLSNLVAGGQYGIDAYLSITNNASGGLKLAFNTGAGFATATDLQVDTWAYNTTTLAAQGSITSLASNLVALTGALTVVRLAGFINVNAGGLLGLMFAQNASFATATTINVGSWIKMTRFA